MAGDFFDVIDLDDARVAVLVGDAPGHGPSAAELADDLRGQLRRALRGTDDIVGAFARIDRSLLARNDMQIATAACMVVDAPSRTVRIVNAGHPPPLLVVGHDAELIDGDPDPVLGFPAERRLRDLALPDGATVFLYTDGVFERRGTLLDESLRQLVDVSAGAPAAVTSATMLATRAMKHFGVPSDDATVVSIRIEDDTAETTTVELRLYVDRRDLRARQTELLVRRLADRLAGRLDLRVDVVDVSDPRVDTVRDGVLATPTIVRVSPLPMVRVIGRVESLEALARDLQLPLPPEDPT